MLLAKQVLRNNQSKMHVTSFAKLYNCIILQPQLVDKVVDRFVAKRFQSVVHSKAFKSLKNCPLSKQAPDFFY